jgi:glycosyltransferase involved in cell wall biosynthesis
VSPGTPPAALGTGSLRVALVHDWLTGMRGGERVLERVCALFPNAPIYTLLWNRGSVSPAIEAHPIHTSFIQHLPGADRHYRWCLPLFPRAIESFSLDGYDAVVSTSHCVAKGVRAGGAFHLGYVFTPMRYIWELEEQYFPPDRFPWPIGGMIRRQCAKLRVWDVASSRRPDVLLAISEHVAARVARHYGRCAQVIHPPVELDRFSSAGARNPDEARDFYLLAGAFAPYKRVDLAIQACHRMGRRLLVVGSGQEEQRLRRLAGTGVEFLGWVSDAEMAQLYRWARALLFPGEEDFGIVPVEALACGCPVIALGQGGALETVGRGAPAETAERLARGEAAMAPGGVLFDSQTVESLCAAIELFERSAFDPRALRALSEPFAADRFDTEFRRAFEREYRARSSRRSQPPPPAGSVAAPQEPRVSAER